MSVRPLIPASQARVFTRVLTLVLALSLNTMVLSQNIIPHKTPKPSASSQYGQASEEGQPLGRTGHLLLVEGINHFRTQRWGSKEVYELARLSPTTTYEVKVSWPAIYPSIFTMTWVPEDIRLDTSVTASHTRQLLNTEKFIFTTDVDGVPQSRSQLVQVVIEPESVSYIKGIENRPVPYDIIVEKLYFGAVVSEAGKVPIIAILSLVVIITFFLPRTLALFESIRRRADKLS